MESRFAGALVDMDGTLYRGDTPIDGAAEAIDTLREAGVEVQFLTNNPTRSPENYVEKLAGMGIEAAPENIVTAGVVTADYLVREHGDERVFVVGEPDLGDVLTDAGLAVTDDPDETEVVVLSLDTGLDHDLFVRTLRAITPETPIVATNPDRTKPGTDGILPSAGLVIGAVEGMTGRGPDVVAGKPSEVAARFALDRLGVPAERCLLVGDRLDTDIEMGERTGMTTVLVRTGVTDDATLAASAVEPDDVLDSIADIERVLGREPTE
ncbi:HAD-IIA family hydrolase [Salinigranum halophilum]|uniref:HAD-IIA family hydrolase n=1 Tax=Salinigranum halophilum TaxID=2565931 RepID=UPI0010A89519|nr:HAD-IIA family hydrolase [Salinigranum halophilum]